MLNAGELDEWRRLVIHLVVGGFHRLQPPHSFSLLHCRGAIFSVLIFTLFNPFICTLLKKDPEDTPQHPGPPRVTKLESPEPPQRRPHLNQANASFDVQEPQPPHHQALPFPDACLTLGSLSLSLSARTLQPRTGLALGGGEAGVGDRGAPPTHPRPSGAGAQQGEGSRGGAQTTRAPPPRPGRRGRGVAAFVPGDLPGLREKLEVRLKNPGRPG